MASRDTAQEASAISHFSNLISVMVSEILGNVEKINEKNVATVR